MGTILVLYHSQEYGNTGAMAEAIGEGARAAGAEVTLTPRAPALVQVNGNNALGPVIATRALRAGIAAARQAGVAAVFVRRGSPLLSTLREVLP